MTGERDGREEIVQPDPFSDQLETCPFIGCGAKPELLTEQGGIKRIPEHETGDAAWFGRCPASLMAWPLNSAAWRLLWAQGKSFARMFDERGGAAPIPRATPLPPHSRAPKPYPNGIFNLGKEHRGERG